MRSDSHASQGNTPTQPDNFSSRHARLAGQLNARIPGPLSELRLNSARKIQASGITTVLVESDEGWAVGGYLAALLLRPPRTAQEATARNGDAPAKA